MIISEIVFPAKLGMLTFFPTKNILGFSLRLSTTIPATSRVGDLNDCGYRKLSLTIQVYGNHLVLKESCLHIGQILFILSQSDTQSG